MPDQTNANAQSPGLLDVPFGGMMSLPADERVPFESAIDATNCVVDDMTITGRNGYRPTAPFPVFGGSPVQGVWRFRVNTTTAWTIVAAGGSVYALTDPTSEQNSDAAMTEVAGGLFGPTDNISAVQLGGYLYIGTDNSVKPWVRLRNNSGAIAYDVFAQNPVPTGAPTIAQYLAYTPFTALSAPTGTLTVGSAGYQGVAGWMEVSSSTHTIGDYTEFDIGSFYNDGYSVDPSSLVQTPVSDTWDASGTAWLFVGCSPETLSGGGGTFTISLVDNAGTVADLAVGISDTYSNGSPWGAWLDLRQVGNVVMTEIKSLRFTMAGPTGDPFAVHGFAAAPQIPMSGEASYYITTAYTQTITTSVNGVDVYTYETVSESTLSSPAMMANYSDPNFGFPSFPAGQWFGNGFQQVGLNQNINPVGFTGLWNYGAGVPVPAASEFGPLFRFQGTAPSAGNFNSINLYLQTATGIRFVKRVFVSPGASWSMIDDQGLTSLANPLYEAGGQPNPCQALCANGARIISAGQPTEPNRVWISSYVPINTATEGQGGSGADTIDPFPVFPSVPLQDSDGWSFDISPTSAEQVLAIANGDCIYLVTNETVYGMDALTPNTTVYRVFERGALGRRAVLWAESSTHRVWGVENTIEAGMLIWASHDGVYSTWNRVSGHELSQDVRRTYIDWLQPDATTVVAYQDRKIYVVCQNRMMRYDNVTKTWTRHTLAHNFLHAAGWREPGIGTNGQVALLQRLWFLESGGLVCRWQPGTGAADPNRAVTDAGTPIAAWTYSTGFDAQPVKTRVKHLYADISAAVTVNAYKDTSAENGPPGKTFATAGEHELAVAGYMGTANGGAGLSTAAVGYKWRLAFSGVNAAQLKRVMWERELVSAHGG